jgi:hypothetical protein
MIFSANAAIAPEYGILFLVATTPLLAVYGIASTREAVHGALVRRAVARDWHDHVVRQRRGSIARGPSHCSRGACECSPDGEPHADAVGQGRTDRPPASERGTHS